MPTASAEEEALLGEQRREVLAAGQALPPRQREVVVLRYWSHLGEAETAEVLGISRGTVKSTTSRALRAVEKALEQRRDDR
ncbi:RNA polymerase sigma-E factor [Modestobacter italicus]|uniref:RNA polymerase sigma-E factor n=1 Tax=Modestobacter italicus (strain DSM 44449 / CECT 9708 / BC 501) TaxID=2732864 RepID=I4F0I0_MODI5|nr:sigma-70 family RNA polymerase sigma factor [Modestobacter marinus]CCH89143.1 RNA polymerase sigma-E factor [Modestobacter marinus]